VAFPYSQTLQIRSNRFTKLCIFSHLLSPFYADIANWKEEGSKYVVTPAAHVGKGEAHFTEIVLPEHANHYGTLHGPNALHMMGKAAFVCASRYARCAVVMAKADSIEFRKPVRLGEVIGIHARIAFRGRSSMTVLVDVEPDNVTGDAPVMSGRFMMVVVNDEGMPMPIPFSDQTLPEDVVS
jgi:acyl-CoA hydrolase